MAMSKQQRSGSLLNLFLKALLHHYNHEKRFVWKLICCKNKNNCSLNFTDVFFCFLFLFGQKCKLYLLYLAQFQFTSLNFEKKKNGIVKKPFQQPHSLSNHHHTFNFQASITKTHFQLSCLNNRINTTPSQMNPYLTFKPP